MQVVVVLMWLGSVSWWNWKSGVVELSVFLVHSCIALVYWHGPFSGEICHAMGCCRVNLTVAFLVLLMSGRPQTCIWQRAHALISSCLQIEILMAVFWSLTLWQTIGSHLLLSKWEALITDKVPSFAPFGGMWWQVACNTGYIPELQISLRHRLRLVKHELCLSTLRLLSLELLWHHRCLFQCSRFECSV